MAHGGKVIGLQDIQHLQRRDTLAVGRQLINVVAPVIDRLRLDPVRGMAGEILVAQRPADAFHIGVDHMGKFALVKYITAPGADLLQCLGEVRIAENLPLHGHFPIDQVSGFEIVDLFNLTGGVQALIARLVARHIKRHHFGHRKSLAGIAHSRGENFAHGPGAKALVHGEPPVDGAGHRDRQ